MPFPKLAFDEVRMSCLCGAQEAERADRIARLTFEYVREWVGRELQHLATDVDIELLEVRPVRVSFASMSDEAIARASAEEIGRALLHAIQV